MAYHKNTTLEICNKQVPHCRCPISDLQRSLLDQTSPKLKAVPAVEFIFELKLAWLFLPLLPSVFCIFFSLWCLFEEVELFKCCIKHFYGIILGTSDHPSWVCTEGLLRFDVFEVHTKGVFCTQVLQWIYKNWVDHGWSDLFLKLYLLKSLDYLLILKVESCTLVLNWNCSGVLHSENTPLK